MLQFRILGPVEVANDHGPVELVGERQRLLLAALLLRANEVVAIETLVEVLWGDRPPQAAIASLQNGISRLRKLLGPRVLETRAPGYRLLVAPESLDVAQFDALVSLARGQPADARALTLRTALELWRGEPLADLMFQTFAQDEIRRLAEARLLARILRIEAELECGRHVDVVAELEGLVAAQPLHESLISLLMLALYRCGRQAEAMRTYQAARQALDDELGQLPGAALQEMHLAILQHSVALVAPVLPARTIDARLDAIAQAMRTSQVVPVLGPVVDRSTPAPDRRAVAMSLAERFSCPPEFAASLARVGEWVTVTHGVGPLYDALHELYAQTIVPGATHRALAALAPLLRARGQPGQLILSSGFDRRLEQAFSEAGERYDVVSFVAVGRDRGKFLHVDAGGSSRVIHEPNLEVDLARLDRSLILRLNGGVGMDDVAGRVRDSYVVSEDDYIDYLAQSEVAALLPIGLAARLRRSHLLFVGYELDEWTMRVFLRRLWSEERIAYRSWAIDPAPTRVTSELWHQLGVDVLQAPAGESLEQLQRRLQGDPREASA